MKYLIYIIMAFLMIGSVMAVSRSLSGTTITYTKQNIPGTILKGYWATDDVIGSGCTNVVVSCASSSYSGCSYQSGAIRVVGHSDDSGANLPSSVAVTVTGTGSCTLSGNYAEGWKTTSGVTNGAITSMGTSGTLTLSAATCTIVGDTAPACDGIKLSELITLAQTWIGAGGPSSGSSFTNLISAAQNWIAGGGL